MAKDKGLNVDVEFKDELELIESRLQLSMEKIITTLIKEGMKEIKSSLAEIFNKDLEHFKETQDRHSKHHEQHFQNITVVKDSIDPKIHGIVDDKFKLLESQITLVRDNQLTCQAKETVVDKIEEKTDRKKNTNYGFIVMLCTVFMLIGAIIGFILK